MQARILWGLMFLFTFSVGIPLLMLQKPEPRNVQVCQQMALGNFSCEHEINDKAN